MNETYSSGEAASRQDHHPSLIVPSKKSAANMIQTAAGNSEGNRDAVRKLRKL